MGDHIHERDEYMLSYRFMHMNMDGNRTGTSEVSTSDVHRDFMVAPLDMTMTMHMLGVMYAPSDAITVMGGAKWIGKNMNHVTRMNAAFEATSSGLGDVGLSALVGLRRAGATRVHLMAGVSIPVGSIEETGVNPMSGGVAVQMPYPMQLGSGTWDILPGVTVLGMRERFSWGLQARGAIRMGENDRGYRQGNTVEGTAWLALKTTEYLSVSARVLLQNWGDYSRHDAAYRNPMMVPTVREDLRGGVRMAVPLGVNIYFRDGALKGHRIAAEWSMPVYQDLHGPQLDTDWMFTIGWQKSFTLFRDRAHHE